MVFSHRKNLFKTVFFCCFLVASLQLGAMRPLDGEHWLAKDELLLRSLQKGQEIGSEHNPCTNIPGSETGVCKLGGMNIAGNVMHSSTAFPSVVAEFRAASTANGTHDQDKIS
ncbi:uncharacterized protein LOC111306114 [Durio zibethinus]|uniref:Uncharacterized protein LOC111306114 n=1 Tax=Durio zibethinus TaxID=66656 RepID=A0A6P6A427_DURZI|nr:uncharacterized protein LOC111306114 [Durio zibethinus]